MNMNPDLISFSVQEMQLKYEPSANSPNFAEHVRCVPSFLYDYQRAGSGEILMPDGTLIMLGVI